MNNFSLLAFGMKYQLKVLPVILLLFSNIVLQKVCQAHSEKPNNVFILADNFEWLKYSEMN